MALREKALLPSSTQKCRQTEGECSLPGSSPIPLARGRRGRRLECPRVSARSQCHRLRGLPEQAQHPWVRLQDKVFSSRLFLPHTSRRRLIDNRPKHTQLLDGVDEFME